MDERIVSAIEQYRIKLAQSRNHLTLIEPLLIKLEDPTISSDERTLLTAQILGMFELLKQEIDFCKGDVIKLNQAIYILNMALKEEAKYKEETMVDNSVYSLPPILPTKKSNAN